MKIGLLLCDHIADRFRHIEGDYPEMFGRLFLSHVPDLELIPYDICNDQWPETLDLCDAFMTTGSRLSVYDEVPWLRTFKTFVREVRQAEKPFIGICFGHQMMAQALGGRVSKADYGWGVSVHPIEILHREAWMRPFRSVVNLQYMHQDQVIEMPEDSVLLGRSDHCPIAMFRTGRTMLGIQAHPEFDRNYVDALLGDRIERIGKDRVSDAQARLDVPADSSLIAGWIVEFLSHWNADLRSG